MMYLQGGIKAVIWTDVFQSFFIFIGLVVVVVLVGHRYKYTHTNTHTQIHLHATICQHNVWTISQGKASPASYNIDIGRLGPF